MTNHMGMHTGQSSTPVAQGQPSSLNVCVLQGSAKVQGMRETNVHKGSPAASTSVSYKALLKQSVAFAVSPT
jgi:hypothetical protein